MRRRRSAKLTWGRLVWDILFSAAWFFVWIHGGGDTSLWFRIFSAALAFGALVVGLKLLIEKLIYSRRSAEAHGRLPS